MTINLYYNLYQTKAMLIVFDWDGTIAKKEVANEASIRRFRELGSDVSKEWLAEAQKTHAHYDMNKQLIEKKFGITDEREKTIKMTSLFHKYYAEVVSEWKEKIFYEGMLDTLKEIKKEHKLAIATTLIQPLIDDSLKILKCSNLFDCVVGNTHALDHSKTTLIRMVADKVGKPSYMIGDRYDDLVAGKENGAETILVLWGNNTEEAKDSADYVISSPKELLSILKIR